MKKSLKLVLYILFFVLSISNAAASETVGKELSPAQTEIYSDKASDDAKKVMIPLSVRYAVDSNDSWNCSSIPDYEFKETELPFLGGFFEGSLWLDIKFVNIAENPGSTYNLCFTNDFIDEAELYVRRGGKWTFYGKTGHSIDKKELTKKTWDLTIPINMLELDNSQINYIRLRITASISPVIDLILIPGRKYDTLYTKKTAQGLIIFYIEILLILFLLTVGIISKDSFFTLSSVSAFLHFSMQFELRGFGSLYLWNFIARHNLRIQVLYIISELFMIAYSFTIMNLTSRIEEKKRRTPYVTAIALCIFTAAASLTVQSKIVMFSIYIWTRIASRAILGTAVIVTEKKRTNEFFIQTVFFIAASCSGIILGLLTFFQAFFSLGSFMTIIRNSFLPFAVEFMFMTVPTVYTVLRNISRKSTRLKNELSLLKNTNETLIGNNTFYRNICSHILNTADTIENTLRLTYSKHNINEMMRFHHLLMGSSKKIHDYLAFACTLESNDTPKESLVELLKFFSVTVESYYSDASRKDQTLSITPSIPVDTQVSVNPNLLSCIFNSFMSIIINNVPDKKKMDIVLKKYGNIFTLTAQIKMNSEEAVKVYSLAREKDSHNEIPFSILKKSCLVYAGKSEIQLLTSGIKFECSFILNDDTEGKNRTNAVIPIEKEHEEKDLLNVQEHESNSLAMQAYSIEIIENDFSRKRLVREILPPECSINFSNTPDSSKTNITTSENLPSIIILAGDSSTEEKLSFLRLLQNDSRLKFIPAITVLKAHEFHNRNVFEEAGALHCLSVPVSNEDFVSLLKTIHQTQILTKTELLSRLQGFIMSDTLKDQTAQNSVTKKEESAAESFASSAGLSRRERMILDEIIKGKSDKEIAQELNISVQTVMSHNKNIFKKAGVHSRVELIGKVR